MIQGVEYQIVHVGKSKKYQENEAKDEGNSVPSYMHFDT